MSIEILSSLARASILASSLDLKRIEASNSFCFDFRLLWFQRIWKHWPGNTLCLCFPVWLAKVVQEHNPPRDGQFAVKKRYCLSLPSGRAFGSDGQMEGKGWNSDLNLSSVCYGVAADSIRLACCQSWGTDSFWKSKRFQPGSALQIFGSDNNCLLSCKFHGKRVTDQHSAYCIAQPFNHSLVCHQNDWMPCRALHWLACLCPLLKDFLYYFRVFKISAAPWTFLRVTEPVSGLTHALFCCCILYNFFSCKTCHGATTDKVELPLFWSTWKGLGPEVAHMHWPGCAWALILAIACMLLNRPYWFLNCQKYRKTVGLIYFLCSSAACAGTATGLCWLSSKMYMSNIINNGNLFFRSLDFHIWIAQVEYWGQIRYTPILDNKTLIDTFFFRDGLRKPEVIMWLSCVLIEWTQQYEPKS